MKFYFHPLWRGFVAGLLLLGLVRQPAAATETNKTLVVHARTVTAGASVAAPVPPPPLPQSTFAIPRKFTEGKDPFFPNSTRVYGTDNSIKATNAPSVVADLVLKGISGSVEQPLAIINSTTFTTGEANEVIVKNGRVRVLCLEINMATGTALVQIGGDRRELRLQPLK